MYGQVFEEGTRQFVQLRWGKDFLIFLLLRVRWGKDFFNFFITEMRKYVLICFITEMGKDEQEMGVLCNKTGVCAIKNPGLEFCAINAGIQQLSSSGGRGECSFLET